MKKKNSLHSKAPGSKLPVSFKYYPVFLNLNGKKAVVVGGGKTAERKVLTLLKAGALVKVVSPDITATLEKLKKKVI